MKAHLGLLEIQTADWNVVERRSLSVSIFNWTRCKHQKKVSTREKGLKRDRDSCWYTGNDLWDGGNGTSNLTSLFGFVPRQAKRWGLSNFLVSRLRRTAKKKTFWAKHFSFHPSPNSVKKRKITSRLQTVKVKSSMKFMEKLNWIREESLASWQ